MNSTEPAIYQLKGVIRNYDWGGQNFYQNYYQPQTRTKNPWLNIGLALMILLPLNLS